MNKSLILLFSVVIFLSVSGSVLAAPITLPNPLCPAGVDSAGNAVDPENCVRTFREVIQKIIDFILSIIGILATLMFVIAGIMFITSAGNPEKAGQAKKIAIYAGVGIAVVIIGKGLIEVIPEIIGEAPSSP